MNAPYAITPDEGLNIIGRFSDKAKMGITCIALDSQTHGKKFRAVLKQALRRAVVEINHPF